MDLLSDLKVTLLLEALILLIICFCFFNVIGTIWSLGFHAGKASSH